MRAVPPPPFPVFERSSGTTSAVVVGCRALSGCFSGVLQPVLVRPASAAHLRAVRALSGRSSQYS